MKNMKYVYASLMAIITVILLLGNNIVKDTFERVFAFGGNPITVTGGKIQVSVGSGSTCTLKNDATVMCWGYNEHGQLGNNSTGSSSIPVAVSNLTGVTAISGGAFHTCALRDNNTVMCWGNNDHGQLGNNSTGSSSIPVAVSSLTGVTAISGGGWYTCALRDNNTVMCWGQNNAGQLGNGTENDSTIPVAVSSLTGVTAISGGGWHTCALRDNNTVMCWGYNEHGQLGNNSTGSSSIPVAVSSLTGVTAISGGGWHTCALRDNNTVMCWGYNSSGQLGNGTTSTGATSTPTAVLSLTGVTSITGGGWHTCALRDNNTVMCWGYNEHGQLGNNSTGSSSIPVAVSSLTGVTNITGGYNHSCSLKSTGNIACWGNNTYGQLGNGTISESIIPTTTLVSPGGSVFNVFALQTREISCGTQPSNTTINTPSSKTTFTQTSTDNGGIWLPTTKSWSYSGTVGECNYTCTPGTTWNGNSCVTSSQPGSGVTIGSLHWEKVTENLPLYDYYTGAIQYCSGLAPAGKWRIPSNEDFSGSILTLGSTGAFNTAIELPGAVSVWSSTPYTYPGLDRPAQWVYLTGGIGLGYRFTDQPGWATRLICVINVSDWTGSLVNGACTGLPNNGIYYNSGTSYALINAASGTSLTANYNANLTVNTCQFKCNTGYTWNGSSCTSSGNLTPTIVSPTGRINTNDPTYTGSGGSGSVRVEIRTVGGTLLASGATSLTGYNLPSLLALSEGSNTFLVTSFDGVGASGTTITGSVIVDTVAPTSPVISSHASGATVLSQSITFTGTAESGSTVWTHISTGVTYSGMTNASGSWSISATLSVGTISPLFSAIDAAGNISTVITLPLTVNPSVASPTISAPLGTINTTTPTYMGSAGTNAVRIEIRTPGGTLIASGSSTASGLYSLTPLIALTEGSNTFLVTGYNSLGFSGTTITGSVIVDTVAPANPIITSHASGATITGQSVVLAGTAETGSTLTVTVSTGNVFSTTVSSTGSWGMTINFPVGTSYPRFTATDIAGNTSTGTTITLTTLGTGDTTAPVSPVITSHTSGMSVSGSITLSGTAEVWSNVSIYQSGILIATTQTNSNGIWGTTVNLISGQNTIAVYATDAAGNRSSQTGLILYSIGSTTFSGMTISSPLDGSTFTYNTIIASGTGTPGNTLLIVTQAGTISSIINTNGSWNVQVVLAAGSNALTFYERTPSGLLSAGINRTITFTQTSGGTTTTTPEPTSDVTPIGSYIPSKNDPSVHDQSRLAPLPSSNVCALDEHVKLNRIITSDIKGNWAEGYIRTLVRFWVIKNTDKFYPNRSITRAEYLALVIRSLRCNYSVEELDYATTASFEDVPESHWVNKYLAIAEQYGWLPSEFSSVFRPNAFITRAEAMDIASAATGLYDSEGSEGFGDIAYLSEAIQTAILTAEKYDIIHGIRHFSSWYFYPDNLLTRAEAAKIIQRTFVR